MDRIDREFLNVQNPAFGAYIISKFAIGFINENQSLIPIPLTFIVLPFIFRAEFVDYIISTQKRSGLRLFLHKFTERKNLKNDLIIQLQKQSEDYKLLTMNSLRIAVIQKLLLIQDKVYLMPMEDIISGFKSSSVQINRMADASEKLGAWCAQLSLAEISQILKVRF